MTDEQAARWEELVAEIKETANAMHVAREEGLQLCRKLTQASARCIRHIHRRQFDEAERILGEARALAGQARRALEPFGALFYGGYLQDAEKEMVEASAVLAMVQGRPYQGPAELGAQPMSYLNGMGEAASECRRFVLDEMRAGRIEQAAQILAQMEAIYDDLITFDFADSMTGGLRRTCDALRGVIEKTRSDLTAAAAQQELVKALRATREAL